MAFLPGWDRGRLMTAPTADVEAARWHVYAEARKSLATTPYAAQLEVLEIEMIADAKSQRRAADAHNRRRKEGLQQLIRAQAEARELLLLDDEDES